MELTPTFLFEESIKSKATLQHFTYYLGRYVSFHNLKDKETILEYSPDKIEDMIKTYIIHLKKRVKANSVPSYIKPIKFFLEVNGMENKIRWKQITKLYPEKTKLSGNSAWQTEDILRMINSTNNLKNKAIIHFLASTGVRVGALTDLRLSHITDMPDKCKMVLVYEDSKEEYQTFLTPEATKSLDDYLDERKIQGEYIHDGSPLFRSKWVLKSEKPHPMTTQAIQTMIVRAIRGANVRGISKDGRYKTQSAHGFRKRFNTILKLNKEVNDNAIEKMLGHKNGLDGVYLQITTEKLFKEFKAGITDLTINPTERQKMEILKLEKDKTELEETKKRIELLEESVAEMMSVNEHAREIEEAAHRYWIDDNKGARHFLEEFRKGLREYQMRTKK